MSSHLERTKSDLSESQSSSKNSFDMLRNKITRSNSLPKEYNQTLQIEVATGLQQEKSSYSQKTRDIHNLFEERINKNIKEYTGRYHECKSKLEELESNLKVSHDQLMKFKKKWQKQKNEHQAIFSDSEKVLADYEQLKSDPQKFEEEHHSKIEARVNPLLEQFHNLCKEMDNLIKIIEEDPSKIIEKIEKEIHNIRNVRLPSLRDQMQEASITPTDKLYIQRTKFESAYQKMEAIYKDVDKELAKYGPGTTSGAQESGTASLPEVTQINHLFSKVKQTQRLVDLGSWCSSELREQVKTLEENIEQLHQHAIATQEQYNQIKTDVAELCQEQEKFDNLEDKFWDHTGPDIYSHYYPKDRVRSEESINIDSTLPGPCAILAIRQGLHKLGIDIENKATERKIAKLVKHSEETGAFSWNVQHAYQHYGFDYISRKGLLPIEQIDHMTKQGHVIEVGVFKPEIGGHSLLIEGVERTNEGDFVVFFDPNGKKVRKLEYKYLERISTGAFTYPLERQIKTREPTLLKAQVKAMIRRIWACCIEASSRGES
jgi:hypothetical protein